MTNEIQLTVRGHAAGDAVLRWTDSGVAWTTFRVGSTPRRFDPSAGDWKDGATQWFTVKVFGRTARQVGESVKKGNPILVRGHLITEEWVTKDGESRTSLVIQADSVAFEISRGITTYTRVDPTNAPNSPAAPASGPATAAGEADQADEADEADQADGAAEDGSAGPSEEGGTGGSHFRLTVPSPETADEYAPTVA
jgi:single-strand DNA-binding protein